MDNIYKIIMSRKYRLIGAIVLIITFHKELITGGLIKTTIISSILLLELVILLAEDSWWNSEKYIVVWSIIIGSFLLLRYKFGTNVIEILWPLVWIIGLMDSKYKRLSMILALITTLIIIIMSITFSLSLQTLFALLGIYFGLRSLRIRKEAYQTSQQNLKELDESMKELQKAHEELQEASVYSMRYAALEERTRIASEIHDGIGHQLTSVIVQLQALELMIQNEPDKASKQVSQILLVARKAMSEVRFAVKEWSDDEMGLGLIALKGLVSQTQAHSDMQFKFYQDSEVSEWSLEISVILYRILQESLTNILRHSNAQIVEIHIKEFDDHLTLTVFDDGDINGEVPVKPGFGMTGMMKRAKSLGGICKITQIRPKGLCVEVTLPTESEIE